ELPLLCISTATGEGLEALFNQVARVEQGYRTAVATPVLNRALQSAVAAHQPPSPGGRPLRLFYATQTAVAPPEFTIFTNAPGAIPPDYTRYLARRFADAFAIVGTPVRIRYRPRRTAPEAAASGRPRRGTASRSRRSSRPRSGSGRARRR